MPNSVSIASADARPQGVPREAFFVAKRLGDLAFAVIALPALTVAAAAIWLINLRYNRGPLFFLQRRMGRDCKPFTIIKFRTMTACEGTQRDFGDPLEHCRITAFGAFLRRTRLDELPQAINILLGHMSLIGPRPDCYHHAQSFTELVSGYRDRHRVRPGITGLAQVSLGYAEGLSATQRKVEADLYYIRAMSTLLDLQILVRTIAVVVSGHGAR